MISGLEYYVYITTNKGRRVLYTGMCNHLGQRLVEHFIESKKSKTFAGKYNSYHLLYWEEYEYVEDAIAREKQIKGWSRKKKEDLINAINPDWKFLNKEILDWPPKELFHRKDN